MKPINSYLKSSSRTSSSQFNSSFDELRKKSNNALNSSRSIKKKEKDSNFDKFLNKLNLSNCFLKKNKNVSFLKEEEKNAMTKCSTQRQSYSKFQTNTNKEASKRLITKKNYKDSSNSIHKKVSIKINKSNEKVNKAKNICSTKYHLPNQAKRNETSKNCTINQLVQKNDLCQTNNDSSKSLSNSTYENSNISDLDQEKCNPNNKSKKMISNITVRVNEKPNTKVKLLNGKICSEENADNKATRHPQAYKEKLINLIKSENYLPKESLNINTLIQNQKIPILNLSIIIDEDRKERIIVFKGDKPEDIAIKFIMDNGIIKIDLDMEMKDKLSEMISLKLRKLTTKIDEVDESEENSDED